MLRFTGLGVTSKYTLRTHEMCPQYQLVTQNQRQEWMCECFSGCLSFDLFFDQIFPDQETFPNLDFISWRQNFWILKIIQSAESVWIILLNESKGQTMFILPKVIYLIGTTLSFIHFYWPKVSNLTICYYILVYTINGSTTWCKIHR